MTIKTIITSGKRKTAIARATLKPGKGKIRINSILLDNYGTRLSRMKLQEPLILAGAVAKGVDINIAVEGGGSTTQSDAARLAISRALVKVDKKLEKVFIDYDRNLLVADVRFKETHKPNRHGKARAKQQKSYR